jgi:hypothetical protein
LKSKINRRDAESAEMTPVKRRAISGISAVIFVILNRRTAYVKASHAEQAKNG